MMGRLPFGQRSLHRYPPAGRWPLAVPYGMVTRLLEGVPMGAVSMEYDRERATVGALMGPYSPRRPGALDRRGVGPTANRARTTSLRSISL
jgi:hypothetical protein